MMLGRLVVWENRILWNYFYKIDINWRYCFSKVQLEGVYTQRMSSLLIFFISFSYIQSQATNSTCTLSQNHLLSCWGPGSSLLTYRHQRKTKFIQMFINLRRKKSSHTVFFLVRILKEHCRVQNKASQFTKFEPFLEKCKLKLTVNQLFWWLFLLLPIIILLALLTNWPSMQIKHPSIPSLQPFPQ